MHQCFPIPAPSCPHIPCCNLLQLKSLPEGYLQRSGSERLPYCSQGRSIKIQGSSFRNTYTILKHDSWLERRKESLQRYIQERDQRSSSGGSKSHSSICCFGKAALVPWCYNRAQRVSGQRSSARLGDTQHPGYLHIHVYEVGGAMQQVLLMPRKYLPWLLLLHMPVGHAEPAGGSLLSPVQNKAQARLSGRFCASRNSLQSQPSALNRATALQSACSSQAGLTGHDFSPGFCLVNRSQHDTHQFTAPLQHVCCFPTWSLSQETTSILSSRMTLGLRGMLQSNPQPLGSGNMNSFEALKWRKSRESGVVRLALLGMLGKGICVKGKQETLSLVQKRI